MTEEAPLDEAVQLQLMEQPLNSGSKNDALNVARPTAAGLSWLAVPSGFVGLAYRISSSTTLQAIVFAPEPQVNMSIDLSVPAVNLACSFDGRLIVVACIDGSLQCFNATCTEFTLRWILRDAHSHVVQDVSQPVSSDRDLAAAKAGPIHSLSFAPSGYAFLLADAGTKRLGIYNAESSEPANLAVGNLQTIQVLSAAWSSAPPDNGQYPFAVGTIDGSVGITSISLSTGTTTKLSSIPPLSDEVMSGFVPTHLDWFDDGKNLAIGYCRCIPHEDGDDDDKEDAADHDAVLYIGDMDENYHCSNATDLGEVVSFFSVPKNGRHVYFTSFLPSQETPLLFVASNVANDVGVVAIVENTWQVIDLQEGFGATCPTDEDDEFTFPVGLATVRLPHETYTNEGLLLASTDGCLSTFGISNQNDANAFQTPRTAATHGISALPAAPLEASTQAAAPPLEEDTTDTTAEEAEPTATPTPVFGSGTSTGFSFGSGNTAPTPFGSPAFGQPSVLGGGTPQQQTPSFGQTKTTSSVFGSSSSTTPAFGSGGSIPVFGSGTSSGGGFAALAASPAASTGTTGFGSSLSADSPFGAFSKSGTSGTSSMVKPLFGDSPASKPPAAASVPTPTSTPEATPVAAQKDSSATELAPAAPSTTAVEKEMATDSATSAIAAVPSVDMNAPGAKKAAGVFDSFDKEGKGTLPLDAFEDMIDELGEGISSHELDEQKALVDPDGTNQVRRSAFISWYIKLITSGDSDDSSLDTEDREERAKDKEVAEEAFSSLASPGEGGKPAITKEDFPKLFKKLGSVYCDEEHSKTVKKLVKPDGKIYQDDFISWYMIWLYDLGDSSDEEDKDDSDASSPANSAPIGGSSSGAGWGGIFDSQKEGDTWQCETCMVRNPASATACTACETPKPGLAAEESSSAPASSAAAGSSIGAGGFSFGGGSSAVTSTAGGFSFGGGSAAPTYTTTGGFSFGGGSSAPAPMTGGFSFGTSPAPAPASSGGFAFQSSSLPADSAPATVVTEPKESSDDKEKDDLGTAEVATTPVRDGPDAKKAGQVFDSFDKEGKGALPFDTFEDMIDELGEGISAHELDEQKALVDPDGTNQVRRSAFISWYANLVASGGSDDDSLDTADREERANEKEKAEDAFSSLAKPGEGGKPAITKKDFPELFEKLGSVYCEDEHKRTFKKLAKADGKLYEDDFVDWYINWLFSDEDYDTSDEEDEDSAYDASADKSAPVGDSSGAGWDGIFDSQKAGDTWQCEVCMVKNSASDTACVACETPKPGLAESKAGGAATISVAAASSSIGSGGFSFGGGSTAVATGGFSFGSSSATPATTGKDASKTPSGAGFSFGSTSDTKSGFSFGSAPAPAASTGFSFAGSTTSTASTETEKPKKDSSAVTSSKGSSVYPPMASTAPKPFGGIKKSGPASSSKSDASAYPPMSSKAPVPFGKTSATSTSTKSTSSAAYPPVAPKAPTPFSGNKASAPAKSASSAYPPMAPKAPTPFGGTKKPSTSASSKSGGAAAYPPLSSKAPSPFSGNKASVQSQDSSKPARSSAYPPMSSKAPVIPFGASKSTTTAPAPSKPTGSFAFPPVSSKNPSPVSASATTSKPSGVAAFPPMSSKAPTAFGGGNEDGATAPAKSLGTSAFPPLSSKAPVAFGGGLSSKSTKTSSTASFPPAAQKAATSFGGGKTSTAGAATWGASPSTGASAKAAPTTALPPWKTRPASSDYESQFRTVVEAFDSSLSSLAISRVSSAFGASKDRDAKFEGEITNLVEDKESLVDYCHNLDRLIKKQKERSIFLLSRKTDIERQSNEARRLMNIQARSQADQERLLETQPLDAESERFRRSLAVKAIMVNRSLELLERRNFLLRGVCDIRDEDSFDESLSGTGRRNVLFEALTSSFQNTELFEEEIRRRSNQVARYAESIPAVPSERTLTPMRSTRRSVGGRGSKNRLTPVALDLGRTEGNRENSNRLVNNSEKWSKIEQSMRRSKQSASVSTKKLLKLPRIGTASTSGAPQSQKRPGRRPGPSLLLSPTPMSSIGNSAVRQQGRISFSSPLRTARSDWDIASNVDQEKVKGMAPAFPQRLKTVDASEASRDALSGFGTTPEKMKRAFELNNTGTKVSGSSSATASSAASSSIGSSSAAAFPPMPTKAPTPFSSKASDKGSQPKASSSYPPMPKQAPKPFSGNAFGGTKSSATAKPPKPSEPVAPASKPSGISLQPKTSIPSLSRSNPIDEKSSSAFGNLKGLGESLFSSDSSPVKSDSSTVGLNLGSPLSSTGTDTSSAPAEPDYRKILIDFYTTHNPAKLNEVDKTLEKYRGREVEMFGKLAKKYKVPSPLDSQPTTGASTSTPAASVFGSPSAFNKSSVAPMPMPSSSTNAPSVFGSTPGASGPAPNPSPFGAPAAGSSSIGRAQPFGQPSAAPSPSPFGPPATQQSSPFGQPLGSKPSPFGPPATQQSSPFGPPASQPTAASPSSTTLIGGRPPREVLTAFYQKYNPSKVNEVDKLLEKYKGNEEHMFRNLAKKYNLDPSMFGLSSNPPAAAPFGQNTQSAFGSAFGSPSTPGGHAFGSPSTMGGGGATFGSISGGQTTPFGGAATQSTGGFGSLASGATGGAFGGGGGPFGIGSTTSNPFGAPRR